MSAQRIGGTFTFTSEHAEALGSLKRVVNVEVSGLASVTEKALGILLPLKPVQTDRYGVFSCTDEDGSAVTVAMGGFPQKIVDEVQEAVFVLAISNAIGVKQPYREEYLPFGNAIVNRTTNPFFAMLIGVGAVALALWVFTILAEEFPTDFLLVITSGWAFAGAAMVALVVVGLGVFRVGVVRLSWWLKARAEVRRRGLKIPVSLQFWN